VKDYHGTTEIDVVYTNDPAKVERKTFVGLDLEYTRGPEDTREAQQVAVIQWRT
jgi:hypothetical protein